MKPSRKARRKARELKREAVSALGPQIEAIFRPIPNAIFHEERNRAKPHLDRKEEKMNRIASAVLLAGLCACATPTAPPSLSREGRAIVDATQKAFDAQKKVDANQNRVLQKLVERVAPEWIKAPTATAPPATPSPDPQSTVAPQK